MYVTPALLTWVERMTPLDKARLDTLSAAGLLSSLQTVRPNQWLTGPGPCHAIQRAAGRVRAGRTSLGHACALGACMCIRLVWPGHVPSFLQVTLVPSGFPPQTLQALRYLIAPASDAASGEGCGRIPLQPQGEDRAIPAQARKGGFLHNVEHVLGSGCAITRAGLNGLPPWLSASACLLAACRCGALREQRLRG